MYGIAEDKRPKTCLEELIEAIDLLIEELELPEKLIGDVCEN